MGDGMTAQEAAKVLRINGDCACDEECNLPECDLCAFGAACIAGAEALERESLPYCQTCGSDLRIRDEHFTCGHCGYIFYQHNNRLRIVGEAGESVHGSRSWYKHVEVPRLKAELILALQRRE